MPDLVGDPRLAGVNQPAYDNPLHDDDPSNDYLFDEWKANADLWREWAGKQDEAIARLVQNNTNESTDADTVLRNAGFENRKEHGMHAFTMYGNNGYFGRMGAAADPGWEYNWSTGKKYNKGTADKYANGTLGTRWESINPNEYAEYKKAQNYSNQGITDYGRQSAAEAFKSAVRYGHFQYDPTTGKWFSGSSPTDPAGSLVQGWGMRPGDMSVNLNRGKGPSPAANSYTAPQSSYGIGPNEYRPYLKSPANSTGVWGRPNATPIFGAPQNKAMAPQSDPIKLPSSDPASSSFPKIPGLEATKRNEYDSDYGALSGGANATGY